MQAAEMCAAASHITVGLARREAQLMLACLALMS